MSPQDVAQAALELAAERFRAAEHIGLRSKSVGGQETIAYDTSAIPAAGPGDAATLQAGDVLMFAIGLDGLDETGARLDALPAALGAALAAKAAELSAALADRSETTSFPARVLNARSGALQDSIAAEVSASGDGVVASVGSVGDVKYAAIQEYGGKTPAHEILPTKAQALAFVAGGAQRFARKVEHPGSLIPERSYLRSSLEEMRGEIVSALAEAAAEAWTRA